MVYDCLRPFTLICYRSSHLRRACHVFLLGDMVAAVANYLVYYACDFLISHITTSLM